MQYSGLHMYEIQYLIINEQKTIMLQLKFNLMSKGFVTIVKLWQDTGKIKSKKKTNNYPNAKTKTDIKLCYSMHVKYVKHITFTQYANYVSTKKLKQHYNKKCV